MPELENDVAQKKADTAEKEAQKANELADQAEQYVDKATSKADKAIKEAESAYEKAEATPDEDKSSIHQAGFALKEAREAIEYGEIARKKAEDARNRAEKSRNVAEEARSTAESARDHSVREQIKAEVIANDARLAKEKAEMALRDVEHILQKTEETLRDVKEAQNKAEMAEKRYRLVIEGSNDGIWDWDIATGDVYWNGRFFRMLGLTDHAPRPSSELLDWVHPEDKLSFQETLETAVSHGGHFEGTFRIRNGQGNYLYCLFRGKTLFDDVDGHPLRMTGMITDITTQKEYENLIKLREADAQQAKAEADALKKQAELANQRKTQALSYVAHEIRTPLNAINGYAEMLNTGMAGELTEKQARFVSNIYTGGQHLLSLLNDILDIAQIEAGKIQLSPEWVMIELLVEKVKPLVLGKAEQNNIQLQFHLQPDIGGIQTDPKRFQQILINLINNAIKYNRPQGHVNVHLYKTEEGQWLACRVQDTGVGIPREKITRLFEEFYRVEDILQRKTEEGTGIGLSLTKRLIEVQGGNISVESEEGVGSAFTFCLPIGC